MVKEQISTPSRMSLGSINCDAVNYSQAIDRIREYVKSNEPHLVLTPNLAQVLQADQIPEVAEAYRTASLTTPDGWPIAAALRLVGKKRGQRRVTGSDLTPMLCMDRFRIGIVGGQPGSAEGAASALRARNEDLDVGLIEPAEPGEMNDHARRSALIERIVAANLDLVFLGVGVPKQEKMALELLPRLDRGVVLCVGASIDFLAGAVSRSPRWVQRAGLEWAYRIAMEPRRMLLRYVSAFPFFVWQLSRAMWASPAR